MAGTGVATAVSSRGFTALRVHNFRLYLAGSAFSRLGDYMESVVRSWLVWQLTGSPLLLGIMIFCHWIPTTTLSIFAGVLADRMDNRKLIMCCECMYLISALGTGILTLAGVVNVWEIGALLFIHGLAAAIGNPSRNVFIHDTVGKDKLVSAVSLTDSLFQTMAFVGPAVAGLLIAFVGPGTAYIIVALAFVPAFIIMSIIRVEKQRPEYPRVSAWRSTAEGLTYVRDNRIFLSLLALATVPGLLIGDSVAALMPVFATEVLHVGAEGMGFLLSANGFGAILAALFISYMGGLRRKGLLVVITAFLYGVFLAVFSFSSSYFFSMVVLVGVGMSYVTAQTVINVSLQLNAADHLRGRVMGLYSLGTLGVRSFNGPLVGSIAAALGAPFALVILGALVALSVVVNTALVPQMRNLD